MSAVRNRLRVLNHVFPSLWRTDSCNVCRMAEGPQNPATEELLKRIAQLERKGAELQAQVDDLGRAFLKELDDRVDAAKADSQFTRDYVWPLIHKVFPGYIDTMKRIDGILKSRPADEHKET